MPRFNVINCEFKKVKQKRTFLDPLCKSEIPTPRYAEENKTCLIAPVDQPIIYRENTKETSMIISVQTEHEIISAPDSLGYFHRNMRVIQVINILCFENVADETISQYSKGGFLLIMPHGTSCSVLPGIAWGLIFELRNNLS